MRTAFRMMMASANTSVAEETLITWSGTNGQSKPSSLSDFTEIDMSDSGGAEGIYNIIGDQNGNMWATGGSTTSGMEMWYSTNSGSSWTQMYRETYDKFGDQSSWDTIQYMTVIDGHFWGIGTRVMLIGDPQLDLTDPSNWEYSQTLGGYNQGWKQLVKAKLAGTDYLVVTGNNGERMYTTYTGINGKDYTNTSNWQFEFGGNSDDWTALMVVPKAGASNGDETIILMNRNEGYFYDWTSNGGEEFDHPITPQLKTDNEQSDLKRSDGHWATGYDSKIYYLGTTPAVSDYDNWTVVDLSSASGVTTLIKNFATNRDNNTASIMAAVDYVGFAKNPQNIGGADGWDIVDVSSAETFQHMCYADGKFYFTAGNDKNNRQIYTTPGWAGDEVSVSFDTTLATNPITYHNAPGESSATVNDKSLYDALTKAISDGDLTGVSVSYNGGSNNGTGVKVINTVEGEVANITISGASSTATVSTYVDN